MQSTRTRATTVSPKDNRLQNNSSDVRGHDHTRVVLAEMGLEPSQLAKKSTLKFHASLLEKDLAPVSGLQDPISIGAFCKGAVHRLRARLPPTTRRGPDQRKNILWRASVPLGCDWDNQQ